MLKDMRSLVAESQKGMSLVEILIALTLMGIAGTFVAGKVYERLEQGQVDSAKIQLRALGDRVKEFRRDCSFYPTEEQGLDALIDKPTGGRECKRYAPGGYIDGGKVPKDPWDYDFVYTSDGKTFDIKTLGADGAEGGEGVDADISLKSI
jgi:general secretion pathway protein G